MSSAGLKKKSDTPWLIGSAALFAPVLAYTLYSKEETHPKNEHPPTNQTETPSPKIKDAIPAVKSTETPSSSPTERPMREQMEEFVLQLQDQIITALESIDPESPKFKRDRWTKTVGGGGYGISGVFSVRPGEDGLSPSRETVLEKAGVNVSVVNGRLPPMAVQQMRANHASLPTDSDKGLPFIAIGLSLVIHPRNPNAPTSHANYRYFEVTEEKDPNSNEEPKVLSWWFGGGADLTPTQLFEEDAVHFHKTLKDAADPHGAQLFPAFKKWCDEYFYIPHREECRGVGGVFFDDLTVESHKWLSDKQQRPKSPEAIFSFVKSMGEAFVPSYVPLVAKRSKMPFTPRQRRWQLLRRGRYAEFNLMIDRGTKFGLTAPGARIESILMSLPETARWEYMTEMGEDPKSEEGKLMAVVRHPKDWI